MGSETATRAAGIGTRGTRLAQNAMHGYGLYRQKFRIRAVVWLPAVCLAIFGLVVLNSCDRLSAWLYPANRCILSERSIHPGMKVLVDVEGDDKSGASCCLHCAIAYSQQTGKTVSIRSVTDYFSHESLGPGQAIYVTGSDVSPCVGPPVEVSDGHRECLIQGWDRCAPSSIAFASMDEARKFQRAHGGRLQTFAEVIGAAKVVAAN